MDKVIIDGVDVSECEHYRAEIETKMPYGEYETQKDKCYYSGIEVIQDCKGVKGCIYKQLKREIKRLKEELTIAQLNRITMFEKLDIVNEKDTYKKALQEIRDMATLFHSVNENKGLDRFKNNILDKINEVIGAE